MGFARASLALLLLPALEARRVSVRQGANPIRKVVTMLQAMEAKIAQEGEAERELYDKFQCFCKGNGDSLGAGIARAGEKIPAVGSEIKAGEEQKAQLSEDLSQAQEDRAAAKAAMAEASAIREREAAAFAAAKAEYTANIGAIGKAVAALEKGAAGAFLQSGPAQALRGLLSSRRGSLADEDRQAVLAFLEGGQGARYAPESGEVTGILKQIGDEMSKSLADASASEDSAIATYQELMAAKKKEAGALSGSIEAKMTKSAELGVSVERMKNDLADTQEALLADQGFLANLEESCAKKKSEWEERVKTRAEELAALAETVAVLNDDDSLELFKRTLPSASANFLQVRATSGVVRARALAELRKTGSALQADLPRLDFVALALRSKKVGFEKVVAMIDGMVAALQREQADDDTKREYCGKQLDLSDDKRKGLERAVADEEAAIGSTKEAIAATAKEIAELEEGIRALDKAVAEATAQRREEHAEFSELMSSNAAAKELLGFAKNRLNKFYNPKLYRPAAKRELSREDRIVVNMGGAAPPTEAPSGIAGTGITALAQVSAHNRAMQRDAPPPPPETFGAYAKKSGTSNGVMAMIDLLIKELEKEMTEAETEEKDGAADYGTMMKDSAEKRAQDAKALTDKSAAKAGLEAELEDHEDAKASAGQELGATLQYIHGLHAECDWLLKYFDARKEARAGEVDSLKRAKAVLAGADFALL